MEINPSASCVVFAVQFLSILLLAYWYYVCYNLHETSCHAGLVP